MRALIAAQCCCDPAVGPIARFLRCDDSACVGNPYEDIAVNLSQLIFPSGGPDAGQVYAFVGALSQISGSLGVFACASGGGTLCCYLLEAFYDNPESLPPTTELVSVTGTDALPSDCQTCCPDGWWRVVPCVQCIDPLNPPEAFVPVSSGFVPGDVLSGSVVVPGCWVVTDDLVDVEPADLIQNPQLEIDCPTCCPDPPPDCDCPGGCGSYVVNVGLQVDCPDEFGICQIFGQKTYTCSLGCNQVCVSPPLQIPESLCPPGNPIVGFFDDGGELSCVDGVWTITFKIQCNVTPAYTVTWTKEPLPGELHTCPEGTYSQPVVVVTDPQGFGCCFIGEQTFFAPTQIVVSPA